MFKWNVMCFEQDETVTIELGPCHVYQTRNAGVYGALDLARDCLYN